MRIAVITSTYPRYQGDSVGSFVHSLCYTLAQLGHDVCVLAPYDPAVVPSWQSEVVVKRIRYIWPDSLSRLGHARSLASDVRLKAQAYPLVALYSICAVVRLWMEVVRQGAEVIYAQWLLPGGFIGAVVSRLTGVPLVVSLHGSDVFVAERYSIFRPVVRFIFGTVSRVIACSTNLARRAVDLGLSQDVIAVVPYGVDTARYMPNPQTARKLRDQLSIPESQKIVMAMGRLVYKKGFLHLLRAVPAVLADHPDTLFVVAGDGPLRRELESLAESLQIQEHVVFTGQIPWDQTPSFLTMADIFVVPSVQDQAGNLDGLPNVLLESMASGCAIVASNVAGIPEVVHDDKNALLTPQGDERALARAICMLLSDRQLRHRLGDAARESAINTLSWVHVGERIAALLQTRAE